MKILIAYSTKSGTTAKCVQMLAGKLAVHDVTIVDLANSEPNPADYDFVAIGGPIRMGKLHKSTTEYIKKYNDILLRSRTGYFICCGYVDSGEEYIKKQIPEELRKSAVVCSCFGGELIVKKQKGFDRILTRMIISSVLDEDKHDGEMRTNSLPEILTDSISRFADSIKSSAK